MQAGCHFNIHIILFNGYLNCQYLSDNNMIKIDDKITKISVIGGSQVGSDIYNLAYDVGREIAKRGAILICGGLTGVMEAACRGAKKEGGLTIGILPSTDESNANRYVDIKLPTGFGYARNIPIVLSADAIIAINGGPGTLSEIGYSLTYNKPIIGLQTWQVSPFYKEDSPFITKANSAYEAVKLAFESIKKVKS